MQTNWDHNPFPEDWDQQDIDAVKRLREFFVLQIKEHGSKEKAAKFFGWKRGASIDQQCDGRQRVGNAALKKIHDKGFSAVSIYPENTYAQELSGGQAKKLPFLALGKPEALAELRSGRMGESGAMPVSVVISQSELPPGAFLVEVPDNKLKGLGGSRGVLKGDLLVCDPAYKGVRGNRPVVVEGESGMELLAEEKTGQTVIAVAILVTMEAVPLL